MRKSFCVCICFLLAGLNAISQSQYQNWQPTPVYSIDKTIINQIKSENGGGKTRLSEKDFTELESKIQKSIAELKPVYSKLDTILYHAGIDFTGVSSPDLELVAESVLAPFHAYAYRQYIHKEYAIQDKLISEFKSKLVNYVKNSPVVNSVKTEIDIRIKELRNDLVFGFYNPDASPIDNLSPLLDKYLNKSLGQENWSSIKNKLSADADSIIDIPRKLNEGLSQFLEPRLQALKDIEYFTDQIKKTEELIKNGKPDEVLKLVQKNDYYQKIIEANNLKGVNDFALKLVGVSDDINYVDKLLKSNENPLNKALGTLGVLEKNLKTFFPEASAELNRALSSVKNTEKLTKANFYASLGSTLVNSDVLGLSPENKKNANVLINAGMAYVNFSSGNILGGIACTIGALDGLGLFGGNKNNDGLAKMQMELQKTMLEGFNETLKGIDGINKNLVIISNQISESYNNLSKLTLEGIKISQLQYNNLSNQMREGFIALHDDIVTISHQVSDLHKNMIRMHDENSIRLNIIDSRLRILARQNDCIWETIMAAANQNLNSCKGCVEKLQKANPKTQLDYKGLFYKENQICYDAIQLFLNSNKSNSKLIDYAECKPDPDAGMGGFEFVVVYDKLLNYWHAQRKNKTDYLSLINPSVSVNDEIKIYEAIEKNSPILFAASNPVRDKEVSLSSDDQLNDARFVVDIADWYLNILPFRSVRDKINGGIKSNDDLSKPLEEKETEYILEELQFLKTVIQNTIAQQSLMSGTRLLNDFYSTLQRGNFNQKKEVFDILKKNFLLQINIAKFICSAYKNAEKRTIIIPDQELVVLKQDSASGGRFYLFLAKDKSKNLYAIYEKEKENMEKLISSLASESEVIMINDKITVANLVKPERVLPPAFHQLLKLHKTYTDMITGIMALKSLAPGELKKMKSVYLN